MGKAVEISWTDNMMLFSDMEVLLKRLSLDSATLLHGILNAEEEALNKLSPIWKELEFSGCYSTLIPFWTGIEWYQPKEAIPHWKAWLSQQTPSEFSLQLLKAYLDEFQERIQHCGCPSGPIVNSFEKLWRVILPRLSQISDQEQKRMYALSVPSLYQRDWDAEQLRRMNRDIGLLLWELSKMETGGGSTIRWAVLRGVAAKWRSELRYRYYASISNQQFKICWIPLGEMETTSSREYRKIFETDTISFEFEDLWVERIENLCRLYGKLFSQEEALQLQMLLPVLNQCIGKDEKAVEQLCQLMDILDTREKSDASLQIAIYRALAKQPDFVRGHLRDQLSQIYSTNQFHPGKYALCEEVIGFYQSVQKDLSRRFDPESLERLIDSKEDSDKWFYKEYSLFQKNQSYEPIVKIRWVWENLFAHGAVLDFLEKNLKTIKDPKEKYSCRLEALHRFTLLFYALGGNSQPDCRIYPRECLRLLGMESVNADYEIFDLFNRSQKIRLAEFDKRFQQMRSSLPDLYGAVVLGDKMTADHRNVEGFTEDRRKRLEISFEEQEENWEEKIGYLLKMDNLHLSLLLGTEEGQTVLCQWILSNPEGVHAFFQYVQDLLESKPNLPKENVENLRKLLGSLLAAEQYETERKRESVMEFLKSLRTLFPGNKYIDVIQKGIQAAKAFFPEED